MPVARCCDKHRYVSARLNTNGFGEFVINCRQKKGRAEALP